MAIEIIPAATQQLIAAEIDMPLPAPIERAGPAARVARDAAKQNRHLPALRGFLDGLVNRHVVNPNRAASVKGVKDQVIEGKTPEMAVEQARTLMAAIELSEMVKDEQEQEIEKPLVIGLRDLAILAALRFTACRAGGQAAAGGFLA